MKKWYFNKIYIYLIAIFPAVQSIKIALFRNILLPSIPDIPENFIIENCAVEKPST